MKSRSLIFDISTRKESNVEFGTSEQSGTSSELGRIVSACVSAVGRCTVISMVFSYPFKGSKQPL